MIEAPLILFLAVQMFSPGPNVVMLVTSAARFGPRATLPHLVGVVLGVGVIGAVSAAGIGALLLARPGLRLALQLLACGWILWLAWGLLRSEGPRRAALATRPMTLPEAALFQWVNPKIWAIALAASAAHGSGQGPVAEALRMGLAFMAVNTVVCLSWTAFGAWLSRLLTSPAAWARFRLVMGLALAASAGLVFL